VKFTCPRAPLAEALQAVSGAIPARGASIKDVLENVRIAASKDGLDLFGTDLEVSMRYSIPASEEGLRISEPGSFLVLARPLSAILHELPDEPVTVSWKGGNCSVQSDAGSFRVTGQDPDAFPSIEIPEMKGGIEIEGPVLRDLVARTAFSAAREKMRYALNGILLIAKGDQLQGIATDGRRLSHVVAKCRNPGKGEHRAIVPTRALTQVVKSLREEDAAVRVTFSESQAAVAAGRASILARLVEGTYPNFEEVIPGNCERRAVLDREKFAAGLRRAAVLVTREAPAGGSVLLRFREGEDLVLTAQVPDVGEATVKVPCKYSGADDEVGYNPSFLLDALGVITSPEVSFEFNSKASPGKLSDGDRFTYVVMPVHVA